MFITKFSLFEASWSSSLFSLPYYKLFTSFVSIITSFICPCQLSFILHYLFSASAVLTIPCSSNSLLSVLIRSLDITLEILDFLYFILICPSVLISLSERFSLEMWVDAIFENQIYLHRSNYCRSANNHIGYLNHIIVDGVFL